MIGKFSERDTHSRDKKQDKQDKNGDDRVNKKVTDLPPWDSLMKRMVWRQLGDIRGKKVLDFGSGIGVTANYLAKYNDVIAIEPEETSVKNRWAENNYIQITGSTEELRKLDNKTFDWIICHNVLEYAADREEIVREFERILKPDGTISLVKHNRAGRVMQMVVLLNNFKHAYQLLEGNDGTSSQYGAIRYYEDVDIETWCENLKITKILGMRTFWDMQQNQEIHKDTEWQKNMLEMELRVSDLDEYKNIAFFHHLILKKK
ncbi:MAG: methyltransferase domain-containing protein [Lachnospiraceae bacterium]|jgi:S-adenosylmethionine-dependent methyltransferase|nr:methyltransferase domain-containing protein [Lachnospiraceae bacterium]